MQTTHIRSIRNCGRTRHTDHIHKSGKYDNDNGQNPSDPMNRLHLVGDDNNNNSKTIDKHGSNKRLTDFQVHNY